MTSERVGNGKKWSQRVRPGPRLQKHLECLLTVLMFVCVCVRERDGASLYFFASQEGHK